MNNTITMPMDKETKDAIIFMVYMVLRDPDYQAVFSNTEVSLIQKFKQSLLEWEEDETK